LLTFSNTSWPQPKAAELMNGDAPRRHGRSGARDIDSRLIAVFLLDDAEQQIRDIDRHSFRVPCTMLEPSFVRKRQDRKMAHPPGIREGRLKRILALVISIIREEDPSVLLATVPKRTVVETVWKLEIGERREVEVKLRENGPQIERFQQLAKVGQVALDIHVG
jgi:hypothetical protein